jgi:hypothetical protein
MDKENLIVEGKQYIILKSNILGSGVDGEVYETITNNKKIAVKIMKNIFENDETLCNFINVNKMASELNLGPKIYFIGLINNLIYIFMEKLDCTLSQWIERKLLIGNSPEQIKKTLNQILFPLYERLKKNNITIGDNNTDNYMFKNNQIFKIDYTNCRKKSYLSNKDIQKYSYINICLYGHMYRIQINIDTKY